MGWKLTACGCVFAVLCVGACAVPGSAERPARPVSSDEAMGGTWVDPGPFSPRGVRVYPLTRLDLEAEGGPVLIVHLEIADAWGDTAKAVGEFEFSLEGVSGEESSWRIGVWDPAESSRYYDPPTRTYRVVLGALPAWVVEAGRAGTPLALEVELITPSESGGMVELTAEGEVVGG